MAWPAAAPAATATQENNQIANPASKNCIDKSGKLDIRTSGDGGQVGICVFPNGKECEEWAFMRGQCSPDEKTADSAFFSNAAYQFSLNYPQAWTVEKKEISGSQPFTVTFKNGHNILSLQVKRDAEKTVIDAAAPQGGEISQLASLSVLGQDVPFQVVKLEGQIKSGSAVVKSGDIQFHFRIDNPDDPQIPGDILQTAQDIIKSLKLMD